MSETGRLIILSGPSGAGKSTVVRELLAACPLPLQLSVSATTRKPRSGEVDGRDYNFMTREAFDQLRAEHAFLECKEVFGRGDWYGTPERDVEQGIRKGKWMLLEIDVEGALSVMDKRQNAITFFVHPGSLEELEKRLRSRKTDDEAAVQRRLEVAKQELQAMQHYRYEIINREVKQAAAEICHTLQHYS